MLAAAAEEVEQASATVAPEQVMLKPLPPALSVKVTYWQALVDEAEQGAVVVVEPFVVGEAVAQHDDEHVPVAVVKSVADVVEPVEEVAAEHFVKEEVAEVVIPPFSTAGFVESPGRIASRVGVGGGCPTIRPRSQGMSSPVSGWTANFGTVAGVPLLSRIYVGNGSR